jgi:ABC-type transport system involved in multi-copper enzyme maturation permease subunit
MRGICLVALAVYRESVRDRVPLSIVGFGVLLVAATYLISQLTAGQDLKVIKDLGLAALSMLGVLIAVFIGIGLVAKEVERRSIYGVLSKPLTREEFLLGKYAGLVMTLAVNLAAMCAAYYLVLGYHDLTTS